MNHAQAQQAFDDYLAGRLSPAEAAGFDAHLATCDACRRELDARLHLQQRLAALPRGIAPRRNLWPEIAARLQPRRAPATPALRRLLWRRPLFWPAAVGAGVAAAALLIALLHPGALRWPGSSAPPSGQPLGPRVVAPSAALDAPQDPFGTSTILAALDAECRAGDAEYERLATEHQTAEGNPLFELFAANFQIVNQAVADAREAWRSNPQSPQLIRMLVAAYQAKATLQGRAAETLAGG